MENNSNRRLLIAIGFVLFFAVVVLVWYFFYAKPLTAQSINGTNDPFPTQKSPARFQFLTWGQENTSTTTTEITDPLLVPLTKVWDKPATGQTFVVQNILKDTLVMVPFGTTTAEVKKSIRATSTVLMFVDRTTGYVYGFPLERGKVFQISNTILPGVFDAYFFNNGKDVVLRYIDQEKNKVISVLARVPSVKAEETALPLENIRYITSEVASIATNFKKNKISYLVTESDRSLVYTITSQGPVVIASSPFREWDLTYGGDSLYVTTKPSAYVEGSTYSIPPFQSELSERTGLMSNPGSGGLLINSMWSNKGLTTFFSRNGDLTVIPTLTLAPKCAWGNRNFLVCAVPRTLPRKTEGLPDDWIQGRVTFNDDMFVIDTTTGEKYTLYTFTQENGLFDVTHISIEEKNDFLSFNKKQDASLWMLNLKRIRGE